MDPQRMTPEQRRRLAQESASWPARCVPVPRNLWPADHRAVVAVWRSSRFLVMQFDAPAPALCRLSVLRTAVRNGGWVDGITWDELQEVKQQVGYGQHAAVELYPPDPMVVNVANLRHLWVLAAPPAFMWGVSPEVTA